MHDKQDAMQKRVIIGIDLGTTNSGVAIWDEEHGQAVMLENAEGHNLTPSMVGWQRSSSQWIVGEAAKELGNEQPRDVVYSIKRYIGRRFTDPEVSSRHHELAYHLISGAGRDQLRDVVVDFGIDDTGELLQLTAPGVSAKVLSKLRHDAANRLSVPLEELNSAVITVPAYFNVLQRRATIEAGREAGLEVVEILNEPTAAALAYYDVILSSEEKRILVYDLGGGTFDVSLLEASRDNVGYAFYTIVVDGDTRLGGDDIDLNVVYWLIREIEQRYGVIVQVDDIVTRERLRRIAECAKIKLSNQNCDRINVELPDLDTGDRESFIMQIELTREQLETCAQDVIRRTLSITSRAVKDIAGLTWDQIDEVILIGGQTLMPLVQREVTRLTGHTPRVHDRPQLAVALGAGIYAHILSQGKETFQKNTLIHVIALPLGIRLDENSFKPLVPANVTLPYSSTPYPITTTEDQQTNIHVEVLQGSHETQWANQCVLLGSIDMEVPPAPARTPKFEVIFQVQTDGTMKVVVHDALRKRQGILDIVENNRLTTWRDGTKKDDEMSEGLL